MDSTSPILNADPSRICLGVTGSISFVVHDCNALNISIRDRDVYLYCTPNAFLSAAVCFFAVCFMLVNKPRYVVNLSSVKFGNPLAFIISMK